MQLKRNHFHAPPPLCSFARCDCECDITDATSRSCRHGQIRQLAACSLPLRALEGETLARNCYRVAVRYFLQLTRSNANACTHRFFLVVQPKYCRSSLAPPIISCRSHLAPACPTALPQLTHGRRTPVRGSATGCSELHSPRPFLAGTLCALHPPEPVPFHRRCLRPRRPLEACYQKTRLRVESAQWPHFRHCSMGARENHNVSPSIVLDFLLCLLGCGKAKQLVDKTIRRLVTGETIRSEYGNSISAISSATTPHWTQRKTTRHCHGYFTVFP